LYIEITKELKTKTGDYKMKKTTKYFFIDSALLGLLAASGITGLFLWFPLRTRLLTRRSLRNVHGWSGFALGSLAVYHLLLHWSWFVKAGRYLITEGKKYN